MRAKIFKIAEIVLSALFLAAAAICPFLPFPRVISCAEESYSCTWSDGTVTKESYADVFGSIAGITPSGNVLLSRDNLQGEIVANLKEPSEIIDCGSLAELLTLRPLDRIDRVAMWRACSGRLWLSDGEFFAWSQDGITRTEETTAKTLVLLSGRVSSTRLQRIGAEELWIHGEAQISADMFYGTKVSNVRTWAPYSDMGGAIYRTTAGGIRLVAALPNLRTLAVDEYRYADEGALLPCQNLEELTVPFVGNASAESGSGFHGELAYLFSDGKEYRVPSCLRRVTVEGGTLTSYAFYGCTGIQTIDARGVDSTNVDRDAFAGVTDLQTLYTSNGDVRLNGNFQRTLLTDGNFLFRRAD